MSLFEKTEITSHFDLILFLNSFSFSLTVSTMFALDLSSGMCSCNCRLAAVETLAEKRPDVCSDNKGVCWKSPSVELLRLDCLCLFSSFFACLCLWLVHSSTVLKKGLLA